MSGRGRGEGERGGRTSRLLSLLLLALRLGLLVGERLLERIDLVGALLVLGVLEALSNVGQLGIDLLEAGADRRLERLGHGRLDETGRERAQHVDEGRVLCLAHGELELVDLDLDLDDLEGVVLAAGRLDVDLARQALAAEEDVGVARVGELGEAGLLLDVWERARRSGEGVRASALGSATFRALDDDGDVDEGRDERDERRTESDVLEVELNLLERNPERVLRDVAEVVVGRQAEVVAGLFAGRSRRQRHARVAQRRERERGRKAHLDLEDVGEDVGRLERQVLDDEVDVLGRVLGARHRDVADLAEEGREDDRADVAPQVRLVRRVALRVQEQVGDERLDRLAEALVEAVVGVRGEEVLHLLEEAVLVRRVLAVLRVPVALARVEELTAAAVGLVLRARRASVRLTCRETRRGVRGREREGERRTFMM